MTRAAVVCARGQRARSGLSKTTAIGCDPFEDLSYQICHELRTPLNAVIGFSDLMRSEFLGPVGNSRYREYLDNINDSAQRMLRAAEETLNITTLLAAPKSVGEAKPFNLSTAVSKAASSAAAANGLALPPIAIEICQTTETWGDEDTVVSALCNLLRAAALASPGANQIFVSTQRLNGNTVSLVVRSTSPRTESKPKGRTRTSAKSESELLTALAISLLKMQSVPVETTPNSPDSYCMTIQLERSAQQALAL